MKTNTFIQQTTGNRYSRQQCVEIANQELAKLKCLTLKSVRAELTPLGMTIRKNSYGEYVVRIKGSPAGEGYFATELDDALATGKQMAAWKASTK